MWVFTYANHHRLLVLLSRKVHTSAAVSYHRTARLLSPEDSSLKSAAWRRLRGSNRTSVQHRPDGSEGGLDRGTSAQTKNMKRETSLWEKMNQGRVSTLRVSSELRKLCLDDFIADRERQARQKSVLDSKVETHEVVFGIAPCLLALSQGRRKALKLFVKNGETSQRASVLKVCEEACRQGVQVLRVSKKDLDKMSSGGVHQGVCLQASPLSYLTEDPAHSRGTGTPLWLVLERIQDPMNLGAILRSAYFLGVDRVISSIHHSCPLSPVVSKASSGVMEVMGVYGFENLEEMVRLKLTQGWQVVGTVGADLTQTQVPVTKCLDFQMTRPTLLLMGGEGEGLTQQLRSLCQTLLTIPAGRVLHPSIESLNVSVATGILLHSLLSTRSAR